MGGVLSTFQDEWYHCIGPRWSRLLNPRRVAGQSSLLMLWYMLSIGLLIWGIAAVAGQDVDATTPAALGWFMPAFTGIVHITIFLLSLTFLEDFAVYPVDPRVLYGFFDVMIYMLVGLAFGGLAANSLVLLILTNGLLIIPFAGVAYKYFSIVADIYSGTRGENTGTRGENTGTRL